MKTLLVLRHAKSSWNAGLEELVEQLTGERQGLTTAALAQMSCRSIGGAS